MTFTRLILVTAAFALVPSGASAHTPAPAALNLSAAGQRTLKSDGIALTTVSPASRRSRTLRLPITKTTVGTGATLSLGGSLRLKAGKRTLELKALSVRIGSSSITISGKAGKATLKLFALTPTRPATLDAATGSVSLTGARFALTKAAAKRLKSTLRLRRTPSTKALGTFTAAWAPDDHTPKAAPAPPAAAPIVTTPGAVLPEPTATPTPTATPDPSAGCADRFSATPAGNVDWFACDLPGGSDLRSWTDYVQRELPGPCPWQQGTVSESGGAARLDPASPYDHRFPIAAPVTDAGGKLTIQLQGDVLYSMPVHGIDEQIGALRIEIQGTHGEVYADGHSKAFDASAAACTKPADPYTSVHVLDLDLTGVQPVTTGGVKRWVHVPATVVAGTGVIGGGLYDGRPWGSFTIAVAAQ